jgi:hypothetical protein
MTVRYEVQERLYDLPCPELSLHPHNLSQFLGSRQGPRLQPRISDVGRSDFRGIRYYFLYESVPRGTPPGDDRLYIHDGLKIVWHWVLTRGQRALAPGTIRNTAAFIFRSHNFERP